MGPAPPLPPLARPAFSLAWGFLDGLGCPSNQGYLARAIAAMSNLVRPSDWPVEVVAAAAAATAAPSAAAAIAAAFAAAAAAVVVALLLLHP
eukprot:CAMPEP_0206499112 /NCGR_PEP_ID=MMETSP0324_2-20121206/51494_1 /ASSEMBLY_ACC=CAM_ASM_000836 /TAXON_ID=2866 /ORGANISM="Crypthecodinium cohnii, Strain Seligo" /LENGTH=91 /DNA_ID=CAMNT_0053985625 /DNA_START=657 /DNA_END=932 /DNA_ORIENTATION=-